MEKNLKNFQRETTSVWSFPKRGRWYTHNGNYSGNFPPQVPRNLILQYSNEGDKVLDPMMGGGTTIIEAKILNRRGIGFDINPAALEISVKNLDFEGDFKYDPVIGLADARELKEIDDESIDLVITHPPYLDIISYSEGKIEEDLSNIEDVGLFLREISKVARETYRVLMENKYCAILIGDIRRKGHYVPLSFYVMAEFLKAGFVLKEEIIKLQHNCRKTPYWEKRSSKYGFYLIMHEHLFIFRKPFTGEDLMELKYSTKLMKDY